MGALPRPHLAPGPHRELVDALHTLHHRAGWPSLRRLAADTGVSHTTVSKAFSTTRLPSWGTVELLAEAMGGEAAPLHALWLAASAPEVGPGRRAVEIAGRAAELAVVQHHFEAGSGLLLVTGEAGIGKTTLVAAAAAAVDAIVVVGHCLELSREVPLLPVIDALRVLHDSDDGQWVDGSLAACPAHVRPTLARLMPELGPAAPTPPDDPWGLERLLSSVGSVLRGLAETRPFALHIEDCHWADRNTLDLMSHLASTPEAPPVVATWRTGDPDVTGDHTDWLARARWTPGVTAVDLEPLTLEETADQLRLLTGSPTEPEYAERIHSRSQGVPLYTAQLGAGAQRDGELPRHLAELLDRRIGDLDAGEWAVMRVLGLAQRPMGPLLLQGATGLGHEQVDDALRVLAARELIKSGAGDDAELAHPLFVDAVRRRLVPGEGGRVHARLAEVLAEVPGIEPAEVADHWRAAARPDQEVAHRVAAARRADERFAPPESLSAWLRVLELMDSGEFADGTELYDVLVAALEAAGQITDVDAVRVLARRLGALDLPDARRAVALRWMALSEIGDGRSERGLSLLDEALRLLEQQPPSRQLEKLSADRLGTFMDLGRLDDARVEMSRGLAVREALGDPRSRPWCAMSAWVTLWSGDLDGAVAMAREALASEWPDVDPIGDMQLACATTDVMLHAASPAREVEEAARDTLREIEDYHLTHSNGGVTLRANLALAYLSQGDVAAAREWVRPITRSEPFDPNTAFVHHVLGAIELREGHVQTALDRCRTAAAQIPNHGQNWVVNVPLHAEVELWARQHRPALDLLDEAVMLTLPTQGLLTAELVGMHARGHADQLDAGGATDSDRRRRVEELRATVARARSDPFAAPIRDAAVPAASRWWRAELSRIVGTATVDEWVAVAAEWDRILRVHDAAYSRWRAGQVALREGQGTLAARLLRWAATDARTHEPLARAIALTASGG